MLECSLSLHVSLEIKKADKSLSFVFPLYGRSLVRHPRTACLIKTLSIVFVFTHIPLHQTQVNTNSVT